MKDGFLEQDDGLKNYCRVGTEGPSSTTVEEAMHVECYAETVLI